MISTATKELKVVQLKHCSIRMHGGLEYSLTQQYRCSMNNSSFIVPLKRLNKFQSEVGSPMWELGHRHALRHVLSFSRLDPSLLLFRRFFFLPCLFIWRWRSEDEVVLTFNSKPSPLCGWSLSSSTEARSEIKIYWMPQQGGDAGKRRGEGTQLLTLDKCKMPTVAFRALLRDQPN